MADTDVPERVQNPLPRQDPIALDQILTRCFHIGHRAQDTEQYDP